MEPVESGDPHAQRRSADIDFQEGTEGEVEPIESEFTSRSERKEDSAAGTWMML